MITTHVLQVTDVSASTAMSMLEGAAINGLDRVTIINGPLTSSQVETLVSIAAEAKASGSMTYTESTTFGEVTVALRRLYRVRGKSADYNVITNASNARYEESANNDVTSTNQYDQISKMIALLTDGTPPGDPTRPDIAKMVAKAKTLSPTLRDAAIMKLMSIEKNKDYSMARSVVKGLVGWYEYSGSNSGTSKASSVLSSTPEDLSTLDEDALDGFDEGPL